MTNLQQTNVSKHYNQTLQTKKSALWKTEAYRFLKTTIAKLNPFQSTSGLSIRAFFCICGIVYTFGECLSRYVNHSVWWQWQSYSSSGDLTFFPLSVWLIFEEKETLNFRIQKLIVRGKRKIVTFVKRAIASKIFGNCKNNTALVSRNLKFPEDEPTD